MAAIIRRMVTATAAGSQHCCCSHGRGPGNLFASTGSRLPVMMISGSFAHGRMARVESMRFSRHISSSSIVANKTFKPEADRREQPTGSGSGARYDDKSRSINNQIVALGRDGKWKDILILYQEQKQHFNSVNHATVMSQMSHIRHVRKDDPLMKAFLDELSARIHTRDMAWIGSARVLATILHATAKIGLKSNSSATKMMRLFDHCETAEWLFDNGSPRQVASCVWACGKLEIESPNLFRLLDERAEWLVDNGTPQAVAICAWGLSVSGNGSSVFFSALETRLDKFLADSSN